MSLKTVSLEVPLLDLSNDSRLNKLYLVILPQREFLDMKLITYLQTAHQLPRRTIVQLIKNKSVMLNDLLVEDF